MSPENEKALADANKSVMMIHGDLLMHAAALAAHVKRLLAEVERLRRGELTPDEFQNLCHNLTDKPGLTPEKFFDGCAAYQFVLFGRCERAELAARVAELEAALRPFAAYADLCGPEPRDDQAVSPNTACPTPRVYHCRRAAELLRGKS